MKNLSLDKKEVSCMDQEITDRVLMVDPPEWVFTQLDKHRKRYSDDGDAGK